LRLPLQIVGRERLKTFAPRLEGRCPFQPYKKFKQENSTKTTFERPFIDLQPDLE
jgi:hypothetical protein